MPGHDGGGGLSVEVSTLAGHSIRGAIDERASVDAGLSAATGAAGDPRQLAPAAFQPLGLLPCPRDPAHGRDPAAGRRTPSASPQRARHRTHRLPGAGRPGAQRRPASGRDLHRRFPGPAARTHRRRVVRQRACARDPAHHLLGQQVGDGRARRRACRAGRPRSRGARRCLHPGGGRLGLWRLHGPPCARHDRLDRLRRGLPRSRRRFRALPRRHRLEPRRSRQGGGPAQLPPHHAARPGPPRLQIPTTSRPTPTCWAGSWSARAGAPMPSW